MGTGTPGIIDQHHFGVAVHDDRNPFEFTTTLRFSILTVASKAASTLDCSDAPCAAPPIWKVRIVSCVPGSPID